MKVLFLENIKGVAQIGDIRNVSDGYAMNYLIPKKIASKADSVGIKRAETLKQKRVAKQDAQKEDIIKITEKLKSETIQVQSETNEEGHLYGSVDERQIAKALKKLDLEFTISEESVALPHHLKEVGEFNVRLNLHPEIETWVKVEVIALKNA